jgi:hypothetical protein
MARSTEAGGSAPSGLARPICWQAALVPAATSKAATSKAATSKSDCLQTLPQVRVCPHYQHSQPPAEQHSRAATRMPTPGMCRCPRATHEDADARACGRGRRGPWGSGPQCSPTRRCRAPCRTSPTAGCGRWSATRARTCPTPHSPPSLRQPRTCARHMLIRCGTRPLCSVGRGRAGSCGAAVWCLRG